MKLTKKNIEKMAIENGYEFSFHKARIERDEFGVHMEPQFYYVAKNGKFEYVSTLKDVVNFINK